MEVLSNPTAIILAQSLGIAYVSGLSLYGTIAVLGFVVRLAPGVPLPGALGAWTNGWVWAIAIVLYLIEFIATLAQGLAPAWETIHSLVRPPAAAILAATITWHHDPVLIVVASLLAGAVAVVTHTTKLGVRYICATTGRAGWNGVENVLELVIIGSITALVWSHPFSTVGLSMLLVAVVIARVQLIWRTLWQVFTGRWKPTSEFLQEPRLQAHRSGLEDE